MRFTGQASPRPRLPTYLKAPTVLLLSALTFSSEVYDTTYLEPEGHQVLSAHSSAPFEGMREEPRLKPWL